MQTASSKIYYIVSITHKRREWYEDKRAFCKGYLQKY